MKKFIFISVFPSLIANYFSSSLPKKALEKSLFSLTNYNLRDFAKDRIVDDRPYGGGRGMLIKAEPVLKALSKAYSIDSDLYVILLSPQGRTFTQKDVNRLLEKENLVFICGRYEGIDKRVEYYVDEQLSVGDFIVMGGEIPSLLITEALIRAIPGFIHEDSLKNESFSQNRHDYDCYTRPRKLDHLVVPEVLLSGNHQQISDWREKNIREKEINYQKSLIYDKKKIPKF